MLKHLVFSLTFCAAAMAGEPALPRLLSKAGLTTQGALDPGARPYAPQYPLWSDGAAKARWVQLPPGQKIDTTDGDAWDFPVGTRFWKQFSFNGKKVETRLIWKAAKGKWVFATYVWDKDEKDAILAPEGGVPDHVETAPGKRHTIPSVANCKSCHQNGRVEILGFSALQLSPDRDPLAPHAEPLTPGMVTLATLQAEGYVDLPALAKAPPRIQASSPRERAALGYLSANCGSCHKTEGYLAWSGLFLKHPIQAAAEPALATTVDKAGTYDIPGAKKGQTRRIVPGNPGLSSIPYRMAVRGGKAQMPPLATVMVDTEATELMRKWIAEDLKDVGGVRGSAGSK